MTDAPLHLALGQGEKAVLLLLFACVVVLVVLVVRTLARPPDD